VTSVTASVRSLTKVHTTAAAPGEIAGTGVRIVIRVTNSSAAPVSLASIALRVADGRDEQAISLTRNGSAPLTGSLSAHHSAEGSYVFTLPHGFRNPIAVTFSFSSSAPVTVFTGSVK